MENEEINGCCAQANECEPSAVDVIHQREHGKNVHFSERTECINGKPRTDGTVELNREICEPMRPIGCWATGKCDWNPSNGLTGVKPIVDHYSITRFSLNEWMRRNQDIYDANHRLVHDSRKHEDLSKTHANFAHSMIDKNQETSTRLVRDRTHEIYCMRTSLDRMIKSIADEIDSLAEQRRRLLVAMVELKLPESIAGECIERRSRRPDSELIRDGPEEELIEELALISEIRNVYKKLLKEIDAQQECNRAIKQRLECDWSDKMRAYEIDSLNGSLKNTSTAILFKPGATRFMDNQSTEERWKEFSQDELAHCDDVRQKSTLLRQNIDAVLLNAARDLRTKADNVVVAFNRRISEMDDVRVKLEIEQNECLKRIVETERLIATLRIKLRNLDPPMKVAQTRLDNRNHRPGIENCRDRTQSGLIAEIAKIEEGVHSLTESIEEAEKLRENLHKNREIIENEILLKRTAIQIDKGRCLSIRNCFPSTNALSGYP